MTQKYSIGIVVIFIMLLIVKPLHIAAHETWAIGQVMNYADKSPIPNVNIYFKNTNIGTKSNDDGFFMLRTNGNESTLVFSCVGYLTKELKLRVGQTAGLQVELHEENTELLDLFVVPGTNPAIELMRRVRLAKVNNNLQTANEFHSNQTQQYLVMISKDNPTKENPFIFNKIANDTVLQIDSITNEILFMSEYQFDVHAKMRTQRSKNIFTSQAETEIILEQLTGEVNADLNFYENTVTIFNKEMVSPLANFGNSYYIYYLADSVATTRGKIYEIHFKSKNKINLAFNGNMWIDSATLALTKIELKLPAQANINFIKNLYILQEYAQTPDLSWLPQKGKITLNMAFSLNPNQQKSMLLLQNSFVNNQIDTLKLRQNFAQTDLKTSDLAEKLAAYNKTPVMRIARWIADIAITGYMPVGKIDVGKIQNIARLTTVEGLRMNLPLRTNEKLWKNISIGGYAGLATLNSQFLYKAMAQVKIPIGSRTILSTSYTDDYRRIDYDYNDVFTLENPLQSADEDISSTLLGLRIANKLNKRYETNISLNTDISDDVETNIIYRNNTYFSSIIMPFMQQNTELKAITQKSLTLSARFSWNERTYNDHIQRIYIQNTNPVIYCSLLLGNYNASAQSGNYATLSVKMKQTIKFDMGRWSYLLEVGKTWGALPYFLLHTPSGRESFGYSSFKFNNMRYFEYAADNYTAIHNELNFNGIILNNIPLIKYLNLRELISFKMFCGTRSAIHNEVLDIPATTYQTTKPYTEIGVGVSNFLRLFTLQAVWRLSDLNHPSVSPFGLVSSVRISF